MRFSAILSTTALLISVPQLARAQAQTSVFELLKSVCVPHQSSMFDAIADVDARHWKQMPKENLVQFAPHAAEAKGRYTGSGPGTYWLIVETAPLTPEVKSHSCVVGTNHSDPKIKVEVEAWLGASAPSISDPKTGMYYGFVDTPRGRKFVNPNSPEAEKYMAAGQFSEVNFQVGKDSSVLFFTTFGH